MGLSVRLGTPTLQSVIEHNFCVKGRPSNLPKPTQLSQLAKGQGEGIVLNVLRNARVASGNSLRKPQ